MKKIQILNLVAFFALLIASPQMLPNSYTTLLRIFIFLLSLIDAYRFYKEKKTSSAIQFGMIAIIFDPLANFNVGKGNWIAIDLITAFLFLIYFGLNFKITIRYSGLLKLINHFKK